MNYDDDGAFTRPADGTRLLDMGYGKSGSTSYLEYWTVSDGYVLDFLYALEPRSFRRTDCWLGRSPRRVVDLDFRVRE